MTVAGLAVLPLALAQRDRGGGSYIGDTPAGERLVEISRQFVAGLTLAPGRVFGLLGGLLMAAGLALLVVAARDGARRRGLLALGLFACGVGIPALMGLAGENFLLLRNVLAAWVPLALAAGAGFAARRTGRAGPAAGVALAGVLAAITLMVSANPAFQRTDWRGLSRVMDSEPAARAIVVQPAYTSPAIDIYRSRSFRVASSEPVRVSQIAVLGPDAPLPQAARAAEPAIETLRLGGGKVRLGRVEQVRELKLMTLELDPPRPVTVAQLQRAGLVAHPIGVSFERR
jgi:hypothetical protein